MQKIQYKRGFIRGCKYNGNCTVTIEVKIFIKFEIELVNECTGQVVNLTTTVGNYKELGKYLTELEKKQWRMLKITRKET